jgi:glycosyltransferase involved in cell wall biosynthesis
MKQPKAATKQPNAATLVPLVSVVTVVRNRKDVIARCIQSIRRQTYARLEYIVIDGASTDGTLAIIDEHRDIVDHLVSETDNGIYDAMNKGISLASGEYIIFLNSDDWYPEHAISMLIGEAVRSNADIVHADAYAVDSNGNTLRVLGAWLHHGLYIRGMPLRHETMLVRRSVYARFGGYDDSYRIIADFVFVAKLFNAGVTFAHVPVPLLYFSLNGISNAASSERLMERQRFFREQFPFLCDSDVELLTRGGLGRIDKLRLLGKYGHESDLLVRSVLNGIRSSAVRRTVTLAASAMNSILGNRWRDAAPRSLVP